MVEYTFDALDLNRYSRKPAGLSPLPHPIRFLAATVLVLSCAGCGDSKTAPLVAALDSVPQIFDVTISPATVAPGGPFTVSYKALGTRVSMPTFPHTVTSTPVAYSEVTYQPTPTATFTMRNDGRGMLTVSEATAIPAMDAPIGPESSTLDAINAHLKIDVVDSAGHMATLAGKFFTTGGTFSDSLKAPTPAVCHSPSVAEKCGWQTAVVGETVSAKIDAQSTSGLAWVGYLIGPPFNGGESTAVSGMAASKTYKLPLTSQWITTQHYAPDFEFFFTDQYARRIRTITAGTINNVFVVQGPRRPVTVVPFPGIAQDMVLDTLRGVLYISQPDSDRILRLSIVTGTYGAPIPLPGQPYGLDLNASGDSLLVGLYKSQELGIVNLKTGSVSKIPLVGLGPGDGLVGPEYVKEASNGKVLIGVLSSYFGYQYVWEYNLKTGAQQQRLDATNHVGPIVAIGDNRARLALQHQIYVAGSDSFTAPVSYPYFTAAQPSSDANGQYIMVGRQLFTGDYTPVRTLNAEPWSVTGAVLAPDATQAFFTGPAGYYAVRLSDGAVTEDVPIPETPVQDREFFKLLAFPNGQMLVGLGYYSVALIDLRPLTP